MPATMETLHARDMNGSIHGARGSSGGRVRILHARAGHRGAGTGRQSAQRLASLRGRQEEDHIQGTVAALGVSLHSWMRAVVVQ